MWLLFTIKLVLDSITVPKHESEKREEVLLSCRSYSIIPSNTAIVTHRILHCYFLSIATDVKVIVFFKYFVFMIGLLLRWCFDLLKRAQTNPKLMEKLIFITNLVHPIKISFIEFSQDLLAHKIDIGFRMGCAGRGPVLLMQTSKNACFFFTIWLTMEKPRLKKNNKHNMKPY